MDAEKEKILQKESLKVEVAVPTDLHSRLIEWGEERGLIDVSESVIISYMITETLRQSRRNDG
ncbi:MAG: hypothetical protein HQ591_03885 [candidate division Zixibacteria bacterium]|nr:hypothetical protein [Candidatus Tariuqbacter arcticus]